MIFDRISLINPIRTEGDEEVQDLLRASEGLNLGLHFLSGALTLDPYVNPVDEDTASKIVWLDAFLTNVDRTVRNTNMLLWRNELWLIAYKFGYKRFFAVSGSAKFHHILKAVIGLGQCRQ